MKPEDQRPGISNGSEKLLIIQATSEGVLYTMKGASILKTQGFSHMFHPWLMTSANISIALHFQQLLNFILWMLPENSNYAFFSAQKTLLLGI